MKDVNDLSEQLARIEQRLDEIERTLRLMSPAPTRKTNTHHVTLIEYHISRNGNSTWKAYGDDGSLIYLRQANRAMLVEAGIWDTLQMINYPGETLEADLTIETTRDGDFLKPVSISGTVSEPEPSEDDDEPADDGHLLASHPLAQAYRARNFVILDTETAWLHGEVISIAVIDPDGNMLLNKLLRPTQPIDPAATAIHRLTDEIVANAAVFPDIVEELSRILAGKTIIAYNADYDRGALVTTARLHNEYQMAQFIREAHFLDVMEPFAEIFGDWSSKHQSYTFKSLTVAAEYYGIPTDHAHNALVDCRMTLAVLKRMVEVSDDDQPNTEIPF